MKEKLVAAYERESTLWKNANAFYHAQDWTRLECKVYDYSEELQDIEEMQIKWWERRNGKEIDVTEREIEKRYGKPYAIILRNKRRTNSRQYSFKTKEEANDFFVRIMHDRILGDFKKVE